MVTQPKNEVFPLVFSFGLFGLIVTCFFLLQAQRKRVIAVAADGIPAIMGVQPISEKDVEDAIRKADIAPSEALDDRVMASIRSDHTE